MNLVDRFLHYVSFDTQSDELTNMTPSTPGQMLFAQALAEELKQIGLTEVTLDENGYLMASLPANTDKELPVVGFIAHLDTSPDMSGRHVSPRIVKNYDGHDIVLGTVVGADFVDDHFILVCQSDHARLALLAKVFQLCADLLRLTARIDNFEVDLIPVHRRRLEDALVHAPYVFLKQEMPFTVLAEMRGQFMFCIDKFERVSFGRIADKFILAHQLAYSAHEVYTLIEGYIIAFMVLTVLTADRKPVP